MKVYTIKSELLSDEEFVLITSLQGIVNRYTAITKEVLYIDIDNYMMFLPETASIVYLNFDEILERFKGYVKGIVIYDIEKKDASINVATNLCTIFDGILVDLKLIEKISIYDYNIIEDFTSYVGNYIDMQREIFLKYREYFDKGGLVHQNACKENFNIRLRDLAIYNKWFCLYTAEDSESKSFRAEVLTWLGGVKPIYGWCTDEIAFVDDISKHGDYIVASDHCSNLSALAQFDKKIISKNIVNGKIERNNMYHYLTIVVSDGDNMQWCQRTFLTSSTLGQRLRSKMDYPLTFTISPSLYKFSPSILNYIYKAGKNNEFIAGVSGIGYANLTKFNKVDLKKFCKQTNDIMRKCNLKIVALLDNISNIDKIQDVIDSYGFQRDILGGIYMLDPDKYEGGKGKVFFSKSGKAFPSVKLSLWAPDGDHANVTDEFIQKIADEINSYPIDITSMEGYTVLNVHPWDINIEDLDNLVKRLKKHIKIVSTSKFLNILCDNVKGADKYGNN